MSGPRNRKAFEHGLAVRAAIRTILAEHPPLARPLTARQINALLPLALRRCESVVRWHCRAIWDEEEMRRYFGDSSSSGEAA